VFGESRCLHNRFTLVFPRQPQVRREAVKLEEAVGGTYEVPHIFPIPDDFDPSVPRAVLESKHGYSRIVVSQVNIALHVNYSEDWQLDEGKRVQYLLDRTPVLFDLVKSIGVEEPLYSGLMTHVRLVADADDSQVLGRLGEIFLRDFEAEETFDVQVKMTRVVEKRFFSNLTVKNCRIWDNPEEQGSIPRLRENAAIERGVEVIGDFNDRYAFNEEQGYSCKQGEASIIIQRGLKEAESMVMTIRGESS